MTVCLSVGGVQEQAALSGVVTESSDAVRQILSILHRQNHRNSYHERRPSVGKQPHT